MAAAGEDVLIRLAVLVGLAAVLAGCGSASGSSLEDASDATAAETSRFEMSYRFIGTSVKSAGEFKAAGLFDYPNERGLLTVSGGFAPWGDEMTFEEFRLIGRTGYTRWTFEGKSYWVKDDDVESSGDPAELLIPFPGSPTKPTDVLARVLLASDEEHELGEDQIRGAEASNYRARVDLRKLEHQLPEAERPGGEIEYAGEERYVPVELWIDGESRLRRMTLTQQNADGSSAMTIAVELYDYGVEVDVQPPDGQLISQEEFSRLTAKAEGWTDLSESGEGDPATRPEQVCEWAREELPKKDAEDVCADAKAEAKMRKK